MTDLTAEWLRWLREDRGRAENTITTYARSMRSLGLDPITATPENIETWWKQRARGDDGELRPHTARNNELSAIRSFYSYAQRFGHRVDNPTTEIRRLPERRRPPKFVSDADVKLLLERLPSDLCRAVALGAYGKLRVSPIAAANWADMDLDAKTLNVNGAGVHMPDALLNVLGAVHEGKNIVTGDKPYSAHYLQQKARWALRAAGVEATLDQFRYSPPSVRPEM